MQLVAIVKKSYIDKYSMNAVLKPIVQDVKKLVCDICRVTSNLYPCMHTRTHAHTRTHTHALTHACTYTHMYVRTHACTYTHMYVHTHACTHTRTQSGSWLNTTQLLYYYSVPNCTLYNL